MCSVDLRPEVSLHTIWKAETIHIAVSEGFLKVQMVFYWYCFWFFLHNFQFWNIGGKGSLNAFPPTTIFNGFQAFWPIKLKEFA